MLERLRFQRPSVPQENLRKRLRHVHTSPLAVLWGLDRPHVPRPPDLDELAEEVAIREGLDDRHTPSSSCATSVGSASLLFPWSSENSPPARSSDAAGRFRRLVAFSSRSPSFVRYSERSSVFRPGFLLASAYSARMPRSCRSLPDRSPHEVSSERFPTVFREIFPFPPI